MTNHEDKKQTHHNSQLILTRLLYQEDEVFLSLLTSLLKHTSLNECFFWINELYHSELYSKFWNFIWETFYDFYYINFPKFKKIIKYYQNCWEKNNDIFYFGIIIKNLFYITSDPRIFILRCYQSKKINMIFKGRKPNVLKNYPISFKYDKPLIQSLYKKNKQNIGYYINKYEDIEHLVSIIEIFTKRKIPLKKHKNDLFISNIHYSNIKHILLAFLIKFIDKYTPIHTLKF